MFGLHWRRRRARVGGFLCGAVSTSWLHHFPFLLTVHLTDHLYVRCHATTIWLSCDYDECHTTAIQWHWVNEIHEQWYWPHHESTTKLHRRNGLATSASSNCIRFNITAITLVHSSSELDLCIRIFPATENILSYIALRRLHTHTCSLIPRPTPLPVLWFALTILHWSRRAVTKEKARYCSCSSREWHQVDMR